MSDKEHIAAARALVVIAERFAGHSVSPGTLLLTWARMLVLLSEGEHPIGAWSAIDEHVSAIGDSDDMEAFGRLLGAVRYAQVLDAFRGAPPGGPTLVCVLGREAVCARCGGPIVEGESVDSVDGGVTVCHADIRQCRVPS